MKRRFVISIGLGLALPLAMITVLFAVAVSETEPNDTPATANPLPAVATMAGSINPAGDLDYYSLAGVNTTWGFIALLDTTGSTSSPDGVLTAYGTDGATVLQTDAGSWERGSGIALQNYADDDATHYLRVHEAGNDAQISDYTLRYFKTVVRTQPEVEPNDTRPTGTPSAFTHAGAIDPAGDVDCFAFHGRAGDVILLALDGDPEKDGSPIDPVLELVSPSGAVLKSADVSGMGGKEFIESAPLPGEGTYAYCVRAGAGAAGPTATYHAGVVRNGGLYFPAISLGPEWSNPRPGNCARVGDLLSFRLVITNTSPITIPGAIEIRARYSTTCLSLVNAVPPPTSISPGEVSWEGQKSQLEPGEAYSVTLDLDALALCNDEMRQSTIVDYFFTGYGSRRKYSICSSQFLPLILREP